MEEWVLHDEPVETLAVLQVLGEQVVATEFDRTRHDEAVPPRQREAILEIPRQRHRGVVDDRRPPRAEVADIVASTRSVEPGDSLRVTVT